MSSLDPTATAAQILDRLFLEMRAKLLEVGACLDRIERADGDVTGDARMQRLMTAIEILRAGGNRAEQIQLLFSRTYEDGWREKLRVDAGR